MLKWKALAIAGVAFGLAGVGWGYAQQQAFPGFYELRIYKAQPGKRDALAARFATRTSAIYQRHGITNVGYFIPQQSVPELGIDAADTFIYIRGYPSKEERDRRLKAAQSDPGVSRGGDRPGTRRRAPADREGAQHRHDAQRRLHRRSRSCPSLRPT